MNKFTWILIIQTTINKKINEYKLNQHSINLITNVLNYLDLLLAMYDSNLFPNKNAEIPNTNKYFNVMNISRYTQNIPNSINIPKKNKNIYIYTCTMIKI
jgi:hypothetical protein